MKKHILLTTGIIGLNICSVLGTSNPAARYCEVLGYDYSIETDEAGNEIEICTLPDSSKVDAWDFYRGKVKPEYSYCSKFKHFLSYSRPRISRGTKYRRSLPHPF